MQNAHYKVPAWKIWCHSGGVPGPTIGGSSVWNATFRDRAGLRTPWKVQVCRSNLRLLVFWHLFQGPKPRQGGTFSFFATARSQSGSGGKRLPADRFNGSTRHGGRATHELRNGAREQTILVELREKVMFFPSISSPIQKHWEQRDGRSASKK